jgi:hypothetical protein
VKYSSPARIKVETLKKLTVEEQAAVRVQRAFRKKVFVREVEKLGLSLFLAGKLIFVVFRNKTRSKIIHEIWVTEGIKKNSS